MADPVAAEQIGRRGRLGGGRTSRRLMYRATGADSIAEAEAAVLAQIETDYGDLTIDGVPLAGMTTSESSVAGHYKVTAEFDPLPPLAPQTPEDPSRFTFDFGQDTVRAQVAFDTRTYGNAPASGNLINAKRNSDGTQRVEGVDVPSPAFSFGKTTILPVEVVTDQFLFVLGSIHLHVNASSFAGFAAREVLFQGATGSQRSETEVEITFRFGRRPNIIGQHIGGIAVTKFGWEYMEPVYQTAQFQGQSEVTLESQLIGFKVHELFPPGDFSFFN